MRVPSSSGLPTRFGIHSSPNATTRSRAPSPIPPTSTGGCGLRTGFGHDQIGSKSTCSPWYSASSLVQIALIASTRSRRIPKRRLRVGAVVPHLLEVPARAHAEEHAAAGDQVERGHLLGGR